MTESKIVTLKSDQLFISFPAGQTTCKIACISLLCSVAIAAIVLVILEKARKLFISCNWYKRLWAGGEAQFAEATSKVFAPLKEKIFADLNEHLKTVKGDVLEIGIGSGENFDFYPPGTSLIALQIAIHT